MKTEIEVNRKYLLDTFQEYLEQHYRRYCEQQSLEPNTYGLITFLIDQEVISPLNIKKYAVWHEFERLYPKNEHRKTKTVLTLANRFNISERSIWSILKNKVSDKPKLRE